jgi:hypothetical protein
MPSEQSTGGACPIFGVEDYLNARNDVRRTSISPHARKAPTQGRPTVAREARSRFELHQAVLREETRKGVHIHAIEQAAVLRE